MRAIGLWTLILVLNCVSVGWSAEEGDNESPALRAIGGLAVGHVQSTLGYIGVTADAFAKDVYKPAQVEELMSGVVGALEEAKKLLRKLQETELTDEDEAFIDGLVGVYNGLQVEAKALIKYVKSKKPEDAEAFEKARKSVVNKVNKLFESEE